MKNTEKNKKKWVEKVKDTLELGGKSDKTFNSKFFSFHNSKFVLDLLVCIICFRRLFYIITTTLLSQLENIHKNFSLFLIYF